MFSWTLFPMTSVLQPKAMQRLPCLLVLSTQWLDGSLSVMSASEDSQSLSSLLMPHTFSWRFIWSQGKIPAEISFSIISWQMALLARALTLRSPLIGFYSPASTPHGFYYLMAHWLMRQCPDGPGASLSPCRTFS